MIGIKKMEIIVPLDAQMASELLLFRCHFINPVI